MNNEKRKGGERVSKKLLVVVLLVLCIASVISAKIGILARFADDVILENIQVGKAYNLRELGNLPYKVTNVGDATTDIIIEASIPVEATIRLGYEAVPDPMWIKIIPDKFRLRPNESGSSEIILTIPNKSEYVSRNFQVYISARTVGTGFLAAGAGHRLRFSTGVGPETLIGEKKKKAMIELNLDFKPVSIYLNELELGKKVKSNKHKAKQLKIINWASSAIELKLLSVKYDIGNLPSGYEPSPDPSWLTIETDKLKLKGDAIRNVVYSIKIPEEESNYDRKFAFLIKAMIVDADIPLELYSSIYVKTETKEIEEKK